MTLWDSLPGWARSLPGISSLQGLLDSIDVNQVTDRSLPGWTGYRGTVTISRRRYLDLSDGRFVDRLGDGDTALRFDGGLEPVVTLWLPDDGSERVKLDWDLPAVALVIGALVGAKVQQRRLVADPTAPEVSFAAGRQVVRLNADTDTGTDVEMVARADGRYEQLSMTPEYALLRAAGDDAVGIGELTATLDLSTADSPAGRDSAWRGLHIAALRIFGQVSDDWYVSLGATDLSYGFAPDNGFAGTFRLDADRRLDGAPAPLVRFRLTDGRWSWVTGDTLEISEDAVLHVGWTGSGDPPEVEVTAERGGPAPEGDDPWPVGSYKLEVTPAVGDAVTCTVTVTEVDGTPGRPAGPLTDTIVQADPTFTVEVEQVDATGDARIVTLRVVDHVPTTPATASWSSTWKWTLNGDSRSGDTSCTVELEGDGPWKVVCQRTPGRVAAFFPYDRPDVRPPDAAAMRGLEPGAVSARPDRAVPLLEGPAGRLVLRDPVAVAELAPEGWTIVGSASYEGRRRAGDHNLALAELRATLLRDVLDRARTDPTTAFQPDRLRAVPATADDDRPGDPSWRHAVAVHDDLANTVEMRLAADPATAPTMGEVLPVGPPPVASHEVVEGFSFLLEIDRGRILRLEFELRVDLLTAAGKAMEGQLRDAGDNQTVQMPDDSDGRTRLGARYRYAPDLQSSFEGYVLADDSDPDGFKRWTFDPVTTVGNLLAGFLVTIPLGAMVDDAAGDDGAASVVAVSMPFLGALLGSELLRAVAITWRGGTLKLHGGDDGRGALSVLLDVEVQTGLFSNPVRIDPATPAVVRYQAGGFELLLDADVPVRPAFDRSAGFDLDVPTGAVTLQEDLQKLLRLNGVGVHRTNPVFIEGDLVLAVELGPVAVERARVRVPFLTGDAGDIQIRGLAASLDIPGALTARGSFDVDDDGLRGELDLTVQPLDLRGRALVVVRENEGVSGVLVDAGLSFRPPITLGPSGLGIFGFTGGVATNYRRRPATPTGLESEPLAWFAQQLTTDGAADDPPRGVMAREDGWQPAAGAAAFAAGILLGTVEGGYTLNLQGLLLVAVPGPTIAFATRANVLATLPGLDKPATGGLLAVVSYDGNTGVTAVSASATFGVESLLHIEANLLARFGKDNDWQVALGTWDQPVRAAVLGSEAAGYFMVHGDGFAPRPVDADRGRPALGAHPIWPDRVSTITGLGAAVGFSTTLVLGSEAARIYAKGSAAMVAVAGLDPLQVLGRVEIGGEVVLLIVSFSFDAALEVRFVDDEPLYLSIDLCVSISLFLFSLEACLGFELNTEPERRAPPLCRHLALVQQPSVPVQGMAADVDVDAPLADVGAGQIAERTVPIDVIPALVLEQAARSLEADIIGGQPDGPAPDGQQGVRIGDHRFIHEILDVTLTDIDRDETVTGPSAWWDGATAGEGPDQGGRHALALMTHNTSSRYEMPDGPAAQQRAVRSLGPICDDISPPTWLLFTFEHQRHAAAPDVGWHLDGVAPRTSGYRSSPAVATMHLKPPDRDVDIPPHVTRRPVTCPAVDAVAHETAILTRLQATPADVRGGGVGSVPLGTGPSSSAAWEDVVYGARSDLLTRGGCDGAVLSGPVRAAEDDGPELHLDVAAFDEVTLLVLVPDATWGRDLYPSYTNQHVHVEVSGGGTVRSVRESEAASALADVIAGSGLDRQLLQAAEAAVAALAHDAPAEAVAITVDTRNADEISLAREPGGPALEPIVFVAAAVLPTAEVRRHASDVRAKAAALEAAVDDGTKGPETPRGPVERIPLLRPATKYEVTLRHRHQDYDHDADAPLSLDTDPDEPVSFQFATDTTPPVRLTRWFAAARPDRGEQHVFVDHAVRMVLSSRLPVDLFAAYGRELRVRVEAAAPPHPTIDGEATSSLADLLAPGVGYASALARSLRNAELPCVEFPPHDGTEVVIDLQMRPNTSYTLDVLSVEPGQRDGEVVWRHRFATGSFDDPAALARSVGYAPAQDLLLDGPVPALPSTDGRAFDDLLATLGLLAVQPSSRRVDIWTPSPHGDGHVLGAVLLEAVEPLVRDVTAPVVVPRADDPRGHVTPGPVPLLDLAPTPGLAYDIAPDRRRVLVRVTVPDGVESLDLRLRHHDVLAASASQVNGEPSPSPDEFALGVAVLRRPPGGLT